MSPIARTTLLALLLTALAGACASADSGGPSHKARMGPSHIHYKDKGRGQEALVLIHGWAASTVAWRHQFPELAKGRRVLAVDLLGHGKSSAPRLEYSMTLFADSIVEAMNDAGIERAVLVGHSNGVPVALNFLRRYPERTLAVIGIDGTLRRFFDRETFDALFAPFRGDDWKEAMGAMIDGMPGPGLSDKDRSALRSMALGTPQHVVVGAAEATLDPTAWDDDPIEVPLLLILARQPTWDGAYEAYVRGRAPQVDYRVWDDVGHYVQMERPDEVRATIDEFLEANRLLEPPLAGKR